MRYLIILLLFVLTSSHAQHTNLKNYSTDNKAREFIDFMVSEHNFKRSYINSLLQNVAIQEMPLKIYAKKKKKEKLSKEQAQRRAKLYPKHGAWDRYVKYKVTPQRIEQGIDFLNKYRTTFQRVEEEYGVSAEYIAAIIGIETVYGRNVGKFPVLDTLATLAFEENRRNEFFKKQLEEFILISYRYKIDPKKVKGSYAGAMGLGQFMPSSYKNFGVDFNKDGKISLHHPHDAIASVANYLKEHGWDDTKEVATRVSYQGKRFSKYKTGYNRKYHRKDLKGIKPKNGNWNYFDKVRLIKLSKKHYDELWYGAKNFYVITRYNHSAYYAMSVHKLAQEIKKTQRQNKSGSLAINKY